MVSSFDDYTIKLASDLNFTNYSTFTGHSGSVNALVQLSDDVIASGSCDKTIKLWNLTNGFCIKTFIGHNDWVRKLCIINNNFASCGNETSILIWEKNNN